MPGLLVEVKARRDFSVTTWLKQHRHATGAHWAFIVYRPDGYGPERIASWPVTMRLDDFTALLHEAGYGTGED
jgi:hypothetical protein